MVSAALVGEEKLLELMSKAVELGGADAAEAYRRSPAEFEKFVDDNEWEMIYVSAVTGENLDELVRRVSERLKLLPPLTIYESDYSPEDEYAKSDEGRVTTVRRENDMFIVEGEWLFNLLGQINFSDYESLNYFQKVLINAGVIKMLEEHGAQDGDTVAIYDFEFDFVK